MINLLATAKFIRFTLALLSLILSLWHFGPLQGSFASLLLTVGGEVYLFGYLSARVLGVLRQSEHVVIQLMWVVTCGLCINIVLGAFARLVLVPVNIYVISLHILMLLLSLAPDGVAPTIRIERESISLFLLLAIVCLVFVFVAWELNRVWLDGYTDQSLPVSLADWWAHQPYPENLVSRQIAETNTLTYWSSDGLTYVLASWIWTGGFSAVQLIWYALTPLFAWLVPLAHYALAFQVTKRADTAAWTTGIFLVLALTTINSSTLYGGAWLFGQEAAFQLNTLRTFSTALLMPIVLFVFFTCLRSPHIQYYLMTGVVILALALTHPRQFLTLLTGLYALLALSWLLMPSKVRFRRAILLGLALLPALFVPVWQYTANLRDALRPTLLAELASTITTTQTIIEPSGLLFHPLVVLALFLSLVSIVRLRQSIAAQFIFAMTLVMFVLSYVPPLFNSILRILGGYFGLHFVLELFYIVPYSLILGIAIGFLHDQLSQHLRLRVLANNWGIVSVFAVTVLVLLTEPFPIALSARDQIISAREAQSFRDIHNFDEQLLNRLRNLPVTDHKVVYLTSNRLASYVIESVPNAFTTGGREETNPAIQGSSRFYQSPDTPWLDAGDMAFLQQYAVDYLVLSADNTRVPQLLLQPDRFEWIDTVGGYLIFHVGEISPVTTVDRMFAQMNVLYHADPRPRWTADGFDLNQAPYTDERWQSMILQWREQLIRDPADDLARYGLAFALLMAGDKQNDLWAELSETNPDIFLVINAAAQLLYEQGHEQSAVTLLVNTLESTSASVRVLSARQLLTESFFPFLTPEQLNIILEVENSDPSTWSQLMEWSNANKLRTDADLLEANANKVRMRAALLMSVGYLESAERWLNRLPP